MQLSPHQIGQSKGLANDPSVRVHSEVVTIAGDDYIRKTLCIGDDAYRIEYTPALPKKHR